MQCSEGLSEMYYKKKYLCLCQTLSKCKTPDFKKTAGDSKKKKKRVNPQKNELTLRNRKLPPKVGFDAIFAAFETSPVFYKNSKKTI